MSPCEIQLILHIYAIAAPIERITATAVREAISKFLSEDLIIPSSDGP